VIQSACRQKRKRSFGKGSAGGRGPFKGGQSDAGISDCRAKATLLDRKSESDRGGKWPREVALTRLAGNSVPMAPGSDKIEAAAVLDAADERGGGDCDWQRRRMEGRTRLRRKKIRNGESFAAVPIYGD